MHRFRMLLSGKVDQPNESVSSDGEGRLQCCGEMQRVQSFKRGGRSGLGRMFRRNKKDSFVLNEHSFGDGEEYSKPFSERTQSTMSMSLISRGDGVSVVSASVVSRCNRKSEILRELPIQESEHSDEEEELDEEQRAPKDTPMPALVDPPSRSEPPGYILEKQEFAEVGYLKFPFNDISKACEMAETTGKPIFAFYTTLPGDEDVADEIFSHPILIEAIQTLFVPVLCIEEVTADTPVKRSSSGRRCRATICLMEGSTLELLNDMPLCGDTLTRECVLNAIIGALEKMGNSTPKYLQMLRMGEATGREKTFLIGTRDPADAELEFAALDGILAAASVSCNRQRLCVVKYDPRRISYSELARHALKHSLCDILYHQVNEERIAAQIEFSRSNAKLPAILPFPDGEFEKDIFSKPALRKTAMRYVPLTELQSAMANRLIHLGRFNEAMHLLSPYQGQMLMQAMRNAPPGKPYFEVVDVPILVAWQSFCEQKHPSAFETTVNESEDDAYDSSSDDGSGFEL